MIENGTDLGLETRRLVDLLAFLEGDRADVFSSDLGQLHCPAIICSWTAHLHQVNHVGWQSESRVDTIVPELNLSESQRIEPLHSAGIDHEA